MSYMPHAFEQHSALAVHASAARMLWISVAAHALADAAAEIASAKPEYRDVTIRAQLSYFRSRDWGEVCALAGVPARYSCIEAFLRSDLVSTNRATIYRNLGLPAGNSRDSDQSEQGR